MRFWVVLGALAALAAAFVIGGRIAGDGDWGRTEPRVVTTQTGETVVITQEHWRGFPFGILFIPLIVFGLFRAFGGRGRRGGGQWESGSHDRWQQWSNWHREEHERMAATNGPGTPAG